MLKETLIELLKHYTNNERLVQGCWDEIAQNYTANHRFYHTLSHLDNLLQQLIAVKNEIVDWNAVLFTMYYHDIVYDAQKTDNEAQSAEWAVTRMAQLGVPPKTIEACRVQILATQKHLSVTDADTNYFTDADLSVLGLPSKVYMAYAEHIRREYAVYPDAVYSAGRQKVLRHFLEMDRIYKTDYFFNKFEQQAKQNMAAELGLLLVAP